MHEPQTDADLQDAQDPVEDDPVEDDLATRIGQMLGTLLVVPIVVLLLVGAGWSIWDAITADSPVPQDPSVFDRVLASDAVLAAARIAVIFAAGYLVISVVALISKGQWLTRVGPVEVSESVGDLVRENTALRNSLESAGETIGDLEDELRDSNEMLQTLADTIANPQPPVSTERDEEA